MADVGVGEQDVITMGFAFTTVGQFGAGAPLISTGSNPIMPPTPYACTDMVKLGWVCRHSWLWLSGDVSLRRGTSGNESRTKEEEVL